MSNYTAEIITIGDEILFGHILDTNSQWISNELNQIGIQIVRKTSISDSHEGIISILKEASNRVDIIITTGGLGPTLDDITKKAVAEFLNAPLLLDIEALKHVTSYFKKRGRDDVTEINKGQALLPKGSIVLENKLGTAPGIWSKKNNNVIINLPGIPHEMKHLITERAIPLLLQNFDIHQYVHKTIKTCGIGESTLMPIIEDWEKSLHQPIKLAYLPSFSEVRLRLTAVGKDKNYLTALISEEIKKLLHIIPEYIYGFGNDTLEFVVGNSLKERNQTIATAESCTGGHIAHKITSVPGSSEYYVGGIVAYQNDIKINKLGVDQTIIEKFGAVSQETVEEMALGVMKSFNSDYGIATSGIAGPDGGSKEKPVGTIWIAVANNKGIVSKKLQLGNERLVNIYQTTTNLLNLTRKQIQSN